MARWKKRLYYLLPVSSEKGKKYSAMFLINDYLIRENSHSDMIFDFEGSNIEGIARFIQGFGSENKPYYKKRFGPKLLTKLTSHL